MLISRMLPALLAAMAITSRGADTSASAAISVATTNLISYAPAALPGRGLAEHSFLYTGEWDHRKTSQAIFVVRDGKVAWSYRIPTTNASGEMHELGDATMLSNGNIVFCRKTGASEVRPDEKIVWNLDAPKGTEIHSVQPLGLDRVLVTQNGNPAKLMIITKATGKVEKELTLQVPHPDKAHLQFRRVRQTQDGMFLSAHLDNNRVVEYDAEGKEIWSFATKGPWSAERLKNGNTLITSYHSTMLEVNKRGEIVWQFSEKDIPEYKCFIFQGAERLANGNTVICNWCPVDLKDPKKWPGSVQLLEVTPAKKVVWALSEWRNPDLGPASSIQMLDDVNRAANDDLQR